MKNNFKDEDIGKLVKLYLDPETNPIAKALGASSVETQGRILEIAEDYIKIETRRRTSPWGGTKLSIKRYDYTTILNYKFLKQI